MGPGKKEKKRNPPTKTVKESWVDKITGVHTKTIIAFILFICISIPLLILMFTDKESREVILTAYLALLSAFGGFIVGDQSSSNK